MLPYIYPFGFKIAPYSICLSLAVISAVVLFRVLCTRDKVADDIYNFYSFLGLVSIIAGFGGAMFFDALYKWFETGKFEGGLTFMGGLLGGCACFIGGTMLFAKPKEKLEFWSIANKMVFSVILAHAIGRVGCFFSGCCYGLPTDSIFGVHFPAHGKYADAVFPTNIYETIFLVILGAVLYYYRNKQFSLISYLYSYAIFRFFLEFIRNDNRGAFLFGVLSPSQVQSILMLGVAIALSVYTYYLKKTPFVSQKNLQAAQAAHHPQPPNPTLQ